MPVVGACGRRYPGGVILLLRRFYAGEAPGPGLLFVEGAAAALLGTLGALVLLPEQRGMVPIFLCAIASLDSVEREMDHNRRRIVEYGESAAAANRDFTFRILALFAGQLVAFSAVMLLLSPETLRVAFAHQLGPFADMTFQRLQFPDPLTVLGHNLGALTLFTTMGLLFRHGGALLAVAWNASVWGGVFGWLARSWHDHDGPSLIVAYGRVMGAVLPHMAIEAVGYVLGGFAGVFLSKALARYEADSAYWEGLFRSLTLMWLLAAACVAVGAAWEGWVAGPLARWLGGG